MSIGMSQSRSCPPPTSQKRQECVLAGYCGQPNFFASYISHPKSLNERQGSNIFLKNAFQMLWYIGELVQDTIHSREHTKNVRTFHWYSWGGGGGE